MRFTIGGRSVHWAEGDVERAMVAVEPEEPRLHAVLVDQTWFPPKQVIAVLTGWDRTTYSTQEAIRVLQRLGFTHRRLSEEPEERAMQWEYSVTDWEPDNRPLGERLGDMGTEGWELVVAIPNQWQGKPKMMRYIWKRPRAETVQRRLRGAL